MLSQQSKPTKICSTSKQVLDRGAYSKDIEMYCIHLLQIFQIYRIYEKSVNSMQTHRVQTVSLNLRKAYGTMVIQ